MYNSWAVGNRLNCELPLYWSYLKESAGRRYRFCLRCKNPRRLSCSTTLVHAIYSQSWLCHTLFPFHLYPVGNSFVKLVVVLHKLAKLLLLLLLLLLFFFFFFFFWFNHAEFNLHSGTKSAPLGKNSHVGHNFPLAQYTCLSNLFTLGASLWCDVYSCIFVNKITDAFVFVKRTIGWTTNVSYVMKF